jgi:hypothetical protein
MYLIEKLYDALGIKENRNVYRKLIINYSSFVLLFIIVALVVKITTKSPERKINNTKIVLSPTRREQILEKVKNSPLRLQTRKKIMLSDTLA